MAINLTASHFCFRNADGLIASGYGLKLKILTEAKDNEVVVFLLSGKQKKPQSLKYTLNYLALGMLLFTYINNQGRI